MFVRLGSALSYTLAKHCDEICIGQCFVHVVLWKVRVSVYILGLGL